tara:strand:+ start:1872 stop:2216 length:345 start_codon:yes stop_codon:yes gene_type:complete
MSDNLFKMSNSEIDDFLFRLIINIIRENNGIININHLINNLILKTNYAKSKNYKNVVNYLKVNHKSLTKFIEKYFAFSIIREENIMKIKLNEENISLKPFINDWVVVENELDNL